MTTSSLKVLALLDEEEAPSVTIAPAEEDEGIGEVPIKEVGDETVGVIVG